MYRLIAAVLFLAVSVTALASAQGTGNTVEMGVTVNGIPTLVDPRGMTLYTFEQDQAGVSNCYDQCAETWPPYTVEANVSPTLGAGLPGAIGVTQRADGALQVTYNGEPLYFFVRDEVPGDANGQGLGDVWFAANPATVMLGGNAELGNFLVGPGGMTLYLFFQDPVNESRCYEECTIAWPPLLVRLGALPLAGPGVPGQLGVITREDGAQQVTYDGMPLYFFRADRNPGEAIGHGAKDVWFAAPPAGEPAPVPPTRTPTVVPADVTLTPTAGPTSETTPSGETTQEMTPEVTPETTEESTSEPTPPEATEEMTPEVTEAA